MKHSIIKLESLLNKHEIDSAIITKKSNIRYFSGFTSEDGILLIHSKARYLITDFRYIEQGEIQCPDFQVIDAAGPKTAPFIKETLEKLGAKKVWFEDGVISFRTYLTYNEALKEDIQLIPDQDVISSLRIIKSLEEVNNIRDAAALSDKGFLHILDYIRPGISELDLAIELEFFLRKNGSEGLAFPIIAASGNNGSLPHAEPSNKTIENGEFITFDFGSKIGGYCSDMTRTVSLGEPNDQLRQIYEVTLQAQLNALKAMGPGKTGVEVDKQARDYIQSKGYGEYFGHGLGHGVGLDVHEAPTLSLRGDKMLEPGMVVSCEPGIYLPGKGGVRIEDLVVIKEEGFENLVSSPKELIIL
ncbi:MAG: aminopeptidase P family protein [Clostridiales bacterium]|nr:aminopeptidase P family protein [Clostridiales bacterium]